MIDIFEICPSPESAQVPWDTINEQYSWIRDLKGCPQNPKYHAEGDVWVHTRMVCEAMVRLEAWAGLSQPLREDLFAAALLHDAAKPECTKVQANGRITSRGHARRGALKARRLLWRAGVDLERRERICSLVRHHMVPLYLRDSEHRDRQVLTISQGLRCDLLAILGIADAQGRICDDPEDLLIRHQAFESICRSWNCFDKPFVFSSEATRFQYFQHLLDDPKGEAEAPRSEVVLMSGLPGVGKRRWVERHLDGFERLDLDELRRDMEVPWRDNQGAVISEARSRAREFLSQGRAFVWIDMNLSRQLRDHLVRLFAEMGARVRIVYVEGRPEDVRRELECSPLGSVEDLDHLLDHWEKPDSSEAHLLEQILPQVLVEMTV